MCSEQRFRILIVDRSGEAYRLLLNPLQWNGYYLENATESSKALRRMSYSHFDLVVIREEQPEIDGLELLERIKKTVRESLPVILMVDQLNSSYAVQAIRAGAHDLIETPENPNILLDTIRKKFKELQREASRKCVMKGLSRISMSFIFKGIDLAQPHIAQNVVQSFLGDVCVSPAALSTLELCLDEMVQNALIHGILRLEPDQRHQELTDYKRYLEERLASPEMQDQQISIHCSMHPHEKVIRFAVQDTGDGFDFHRHIEKELSTFSLDHIGRGIMFIRTLTDSVRFDHGGRTIIIEKRLNSS